MKFGNCPECGCKDLGDRWVSGRKLQQYCHDGHDDNCHWVGTPRIPETIPITPYKDLRVDNFKGWDYIIYDKYGHVSTYSRSYVTEEEATKILEAELNREYPNDPAAPYTGVLFFTPHTVKLEGKIFKVKGDKVIRSNKK
jgi:hypothetical protein